MPYPRIKELRDQSGYTQSEIACLLNIPLATYRSYETGSREPNLDILIQLSEMYKVSVDFILSHTPQKPLFSQEEVARIKKYRALDEYGKKAVSAVLDIEFERCSALEDNTAQTLIFRAASSKDNHPPEIVTTTKDFSKIKPSDDEI